MKRFYKNIGILILFVSSTLMVFANNYYSEFDLSGRWRFSIGDDTDWANVDYDDSEWDKIFVPSRWEEEGYPGYNGFAWYRLSFEIPKSFKNRTVFLELGYIDDVDEVFFNGEKIGQTGTFPPNYSTAYNSFRKYQIPPGLINHNGDNTIAVRVYDSQLEGGIVNGDVRLAAGDIAIIPDLSLNGYWNFSLGSSLKSDKEKIMVPGPWENYGYNDYDGIAVYSIVVNITAETAKKKLIFLAGRIDDDDQLFINGELVGATGDIEARYNNDLHKEFRNYFIPEGVMKPGDNTIFIRVIDRGGEGGIIEGNVGLITQENFIKYWKMKRNE